MWPSRPGSIHSFSVADRGSMSLMAVPTGAVGVVTITNDDSKSILLLGTFPGRILRFRYLSCCSRKHPPPTRPPGLGSLRFFRMAATPNLDIMSTPAAPSTCGKALENLQRACHVFRGRSSAPPCRVAGDSGRYVTSIRRSPQHFGRLEPLCNMTDET